MIIIDRFEEGFAICEDEDAGFVSILRELLPEDAEEGDVISISEGRYVIDSLSTQKRKKDIEDKFFGLFE